MIRRSLRNRHSAPWVHGFMPGFTGSAPHPAARAVTSLVLTEKRGWPADQSYDGRLQSLEARETLSALRARVRAGSTGLISAGLCICVFAATARRRGNQYDPKYGSWGYI